MTTRGYTEPQTNRQPAVLIGRSVSTDTRPWVCPPSQRADTPRPSVGRHLCQICPAGLTHCTFRVYTATRRESLTTQSATTTRRVCHITTPLPLKTSTQRPRALHTPGTPPFGYTPRHPIQAYCPHRCHRGFRLRSSSCTTARSLYSLQGYSIKKCTESHVNPRFTRNGTSTKLLGTSSREPAQILYSPLATYNPHMLHHAHIRSSAQHQPQPLGTLPFGRSACET